MCLMQYFMIKLYIYFFYKTVRNCFNVCHLQRFFHMLINASCFILLFLVLLSYENV